MLIEYNRTIIGDDYILQCYLIKQPLLKIGSSSRINLENCTNSLNQINEEYKVAKFDILRNKAANQVEYSILDQNNNIVNLSLCEGQKGTIKYTLVPLSLGIDIETVKQMAAQNIDIFNPDDPFFNDICYPYTTKSNTDIPLKDRRKDIFQNVSLCDTECTYKGFDTITYEVTCNCSIKTETILKPKMPSVPFYTSLIESTNIMIVKCYKFLGIKANYPYNIGFWVFLAFTIIMIISMIYYYCKARILFYQLLFITISPLLIFRHPQLIPVREV